MTLINLLIAFVLLLVAMTVHEFAHGAVAYRLGDPTPKDAGRLTLNPLAHLDPIGTVLLPLFLFVATRGQFVFGAAKPVPISYWHLKNPRRDMIWIGISGPLANFALACACGVVWHFVNNTPFVDFVIRDMIVINVVLGLFNLMPVPPLDGSRVLMGLLPQGAALRLSAIEPFGFFIVMALVALGAFDAMVWPVARTVVGWVMYGWGGA